LLQGCATTTTLALGMKFALPVLALSCVGAAMLLSRHASPELRVLVAEATPISVPAAPVMAPAVEAAAREQLPAAAPTGELYGPLSLSDLPAIVEPAVAPMSPGELERLAARYFHAVVAVEELAKSLPANADPKSITPANAPGYFASLNERDQLAQQLASAPAREARVPLPFLDLRADNADFARSYARWLREDLLLEQWLLTRAAHSESARLMEERFGHGPYLAKLIDAQRVFS
jgi:hypothetical protein